MKAFSDIEAFRHIVAHIDSHCEFHKLETKPIIKFHGTVKLHGTNAGVRFKGDEVIAQGRTRTLTIQDDNYGFALFVEKNKDILKQLATHYKVALNCNDITLFGEWCGKGIQSGVAVSKLEKMLVLFAAYAHRDEDQIAFCNANISQLNSMLDTLSEDDELNRLTITSQIAKMNRQLGDIHKKNWVDFKSIQIDDMTPFNNKNVYLITQGKTFEIEVDFNRPYLAAETITDLTLEVEARCPFANDSQLFPVSTSEHLGIGEGIVWENYERGLKFKSKGLKHSNKSDNVKVEVAPEKVAAIKELVTALLPRWRLEQGLEVLKTQNLQIIPQNTGAYLKWINQDILKEEQDRITANEFTWKELIPEISRTAREFYLISGCK